MVTLYKVGIWISGALVFLSLASLGALFRTYTHEMPQQTETQSGRTVRLKVLYGKTVYVTRAEEYRLYAGYGLVAASMALCVGADCLRRRAIRRQQRP